ncbi:unnamed protein product [Moneuplotes crassus]|uniref:Uncharacterized protein n=1 Tax=Euplotes crassus TaxID=5936 RepID=A0AAD2D7U1_EUPCR|nr:unnamed protein product [Moneuplotes crassus]
MQMYGNQSLMSPNQTFTSSSRRRDSRQNSGSPSSSKQPCNSKESTAIGKRSAVANRKKSKNQGESYQTVIHEAESYLEDTAQFRKEEGKYMRVEEKNYRTDKNKSSKRRGKKSTIHIERQTQRSASKNKQRFGKNKERRIEDRVKELTKEISELRKQKGDLNLRFEKANSQLNDLQPKYDRVLKEKEQYKNLVQQSNKTNNSYKKENESFGDLITALNNVAYQLSVFLCKNLEMEKNKMSNDQDHIYYSNKVREDTPVIQHFHDSSAFHSSQPIQENMYNNAYQEGVENAQISIQDKEKQELLSIISNFTKNINKRHSVNILDMVSFPNDLLNEFPQLFESLSNSPPHFPNDQLQKYENPPRNSQDLSISHLRPNVSINKSMKNTYSGLELYKTGTETPRNMSKYGHYSMNQSFNNGRNSQSALLKGKYGLDSQERSHYIAQNEESGYISPVSPVKQL